MRSDNQRLQWVDMAKGLSILLVVMMYSAFSVGEDTGQTGVLHWIIAFATPFRMPEFFAISGLFLSLVIARDWKPYSDRRVLHYFYFYAVWAIIHLVFKVGLVAGDPAMALTDLAWAVVEPYGVLWFIYMLAVFSAVAKLCFTLRLPHWIVLALAAVLQIAPVHIGSYLIDQFAAYFVYFYSGYVFAPMLFKLVAWAQANIGMALATLVTWALVHAALVFSPGYAVLPGEIHMGLASLPVLHLLLALIGTAALCVIASLLTKLAFMDWLRWLGSKSLVVYLAFVLPMGIVRTILIKFDLITNISVLSIVVMATAVVSPVVLYWLVQWTGFGKFLFERPDWAHIPGTPGARQPRTQVSATPAE
ncbi:acyltransferase family protein [Devosia algicola]|uniref:Acyltransferase family protein n=1 Tax=Devosia algicola TaxID=3026418 RepID=A0ABY7YQV8_9HYPH|nr:acyltransferase family protein [Devosia algicola]WDR03711.1 acyltransferase family protein [Devosia algicola]